jgi:hypothetical protein
MKKTAFEQLSVCRQSLKNRFHALKISFWLYFGLERVPWAAIEGLNTGAFQDTDGRTASATAAAAGDDRYIFFRQTRGLGCQYIERYIDGAFDMPGPVLTGCTYINNDGSIFDELFEVSCRGAVHQALEKIEHGFVRFLKVTDFILNVLPFPAPPDPFRPTAAPFETAFPT